MNVSLFRNQEETNLYQPFHTFQPTNRFISVIGSGGKTTLLGVLAKRLDGRVILTTSTHMFPFPGIALVNTGSADTPANRERILHEIRSTLASNRIICVGQLLPSGKLTTPAMSISYETLALEADHILVEADGAAGHALKAHRPWEPVIPACSELTICVAGASGIGKPASLVCHCPELFSSLAGITPDQPVCEEHIARVLNRENLADCYLINQVDILPDPVQALRLCSLIRKPAIPVSLMSPDKACGK